MKKILATAAIAALSLGIAGSVQAATITQTVSLLSPFFAAVTPGSTSFSQFDAALGTLDSVSFDYSLDDMVYISSSYDYMFYYLFSPGYTTQLLKGTNLGISPGGVNLGPPSVLSYTDSSISQYIGTGTLTFFASSSKHSDSRIQFHGAPSAKITYTYTEASGPPVGSVPEPATWAMMILGFTGVGVTVRRRKAMAALNAA